MIIVDVAAERMRCVHAATLLGLFDMTTPLKGLLARNEN